MVVIRPKAGRKIITPAPEVEIIQPKVDIKLTKKLVESDSESDNTDSEFDME